VTPSAAPTPAAPPRGAASTSASLAVRAGAGRSRVVVEEVRWTARPMPTSGVGGQGRGRPAALGRGPRVPPLAPGVAWTPAEPDPAYARPARGPHPSSARPPGATTLDADAPPPPSPGTATPAPGAPVTFDADAARAIRLLAHRAGVLGSGLRILLSGGPVSGRSAAWDLDFAFEDEPGPEDVVLETQGLRLFIHEAAVERLRGLHITASQVPGLEGFRFLRRRR